MTKKYVARGDVADYTAGANIVSGDVVVTGHTIGVAVTDIANGAVGALAIEGVYELPKVSGAVFSVGEKLIWDVSAAAFDDSLATPASGDITGGAIAMKAGLNGETTCWAKLTPGNATKTP